MCGKYTPPLGIPSSSWGPFRLLLSHGPPPSHPSFFAERPTGSRVLPRPWDCQAPGSRASRPHISLSRGPRGRPGRLVPALALPGRRQPALGGLPIPWGTWAAASPPGGGGGGGPWPEVADGPPCLPQAPPLATTWTCSTCRTCPSHSPAGTLGTASCRLETGERRPQMPLPRRARDGHPCQPRAGQ